MPGEVTLQVDIRDHDSAARTGVVDDFVASAQAIARRRRVDYEITTIIEDKPAACNAP